MVLNSRCSNESTGHGSPMPQLVHGGPGRAGGGEEMGGVRGIKHYLQRQPFKVILKQLPKSQNNFKSEETNLNQIHMYLENILKN